MSTGPYKFADYKAGSSLTLVKNENWDPNTNPGRIPAVDGWDFKFGQDTANLENVIINDNGSAQTTLTYDNVTAASYRQISSDKDRLVTGTSPCTYMWFIDMTKIKDLKVRQAIGYAFPYEAYWKGIGEVQGVTRVPGTAILPPGTAGRVDYDPLGIERGEHRHREGQAAAQGGRCRGLRDQVPVQHRRSRVGRGQGPDRQGPRGRRVQGLPDRDHLGDQPHRPHRLRQPAERPLQRMVLGLAVRRFVVPGPVVR